MLKYVWIMLNNDDTNSRKPFFKFVEFILSYKRSLEQTLKVTY